MVESICLDQGPTARDLEKSAITQNLFPLIQADTSSREDRVRDELTDQIEPERIGNERHRRILLKWLKLHRSETLTQGQAALQRRHALQRRPGVV
jgi:hypothetical protein